MINYKNRCKISNTYVLHSLQLSSIVLHLIRYIKSVKAILFQTCDNKTKQNVKLVHQINIIK